MRKIRQNTGIWQYLEQCGVLDNGSEEEIQAARKIYKKKYLLDYRRRQRKEEKEFTVLLKGNDRRKISQAAKNHNMTVVRFLRTAALAYLNKTYIVPNMEQVASIEQLVIQTLNEIQNFARKNRIFYSSNFGQMEKTIEKLEREVSETLRKPPTAEEYIAGNPLLKEQLIHLLNHDCKDKDAQNGKFPATAELHASSQGAAV